MMITTAEIRPPTRELSPPFMAFWTALLISSSATNWAMLNCPTCRLPPTRISQSTAAYTTAARTTRCHHGKEMCQRRSIHPPLEHLELIPLERELRLRVIDGNLVLPAPARRAIVLLAVL